MKYLKARWFDKIPPGYDFEQAFIEKPSEGYPCSCHFTFVKHTNNETEELTLRYQWFIGDKIPENFIPIENATKEVSCHLFLLFELSTITVLLNASTLLPSLVRDTRIFLIVTLMVCSICFVCGRSIFQSTMMLASASRWSVLLCLEKQNILQFLSFRFPCHLVLSSSP